MGSEGKGITVMQKTFISKAPMSQIQSSFPHYHKTELSSVLGGERKEERKYIKRGKKKKSKGRNHRPYWDGSCFAKTMIQF